MTKRIQLPKNIEREILFRNQSACCICEKNNVQIHHIDGNNNNNTLSNLAVLCIEHHDIASSNSLMTKKLKPDLIRLYKNTWESKVAQRRRLAKNQVILKSKQSDFIKFEITRLVFSLTAFPDKKNTKSIIEQLYNWSLFWGYTKEVFELIEQYHWLFHYPQLFILLERLYSFNWHLVGPDDVPMKTKDEKNLILSFQIIGNIGKRIIIFRENPKIFDKLFSTVNEHNELIKIYKKKTLKKALNKEVLKIKNELMDTKDYPQQKALINKINIILKKG